MGVVTKIKQLTVAAIVCLGLSTTPALAATTLYGMDSSGQLFSADPATAATTGIGSAVGTRVGLAQSTITGIAYTRSFDQLYQVNLTTGANTLLGSSGSFLTGLTFNLGQTTLYSVDQGNGNFYSINLANGAATLIGATGVSAMLDLTTNAAGTVHGTDINGRIYTINTSTGAATLVSQLSSEGLTAIEFAANGDLYGVGIGTDRLYRGVLTGPVVIGGLPYSDVRGLLFVDSGGAVPEPATWIALILGFGLIGGQLRRQLRQSEKRFTERMRRIAAGAAA